MKIHLENKYSTYQVLFQLLNCKQQKFFNYSEFITNKKINFDYRYLECNRSIYLISIDRTDFWVFKPFSFSSKQFLDKINSLGVYYKFILYIRIGQIIQVNMPYLCNNQPDIAIANYYLHKMLNNSERYITNGRYLNKNRPSKCKQEYIGFQTSKRVFYILGIKLLICGSSYRKYFPKGITILLRNVT